MRSRRKSANAGKLGRRARQGAGCALGLCLLALSGCAGTSTSQPAGRPWGEPLYGEIHPSGNPGQTGPGGVPANPPAHTQNPGVPPIPQTQGPATNAALASRPSGRRLAIGDRPPPNSGGQPASYVAPNGTKVIALPRDTGLPAVQSTGSVAANQGTTEVLQGQLRSRGVLYQKQDTVPEGIRFSCLVPNPTNPDSAQLYEATARDYVTAVQAVIVQIDQQRK